MEMIQEKPKNIQRHTKAEIGSCFIRVFHVFFDGVSILLREALQRKRRKAPGFIRGDIRRALDFVFVFAYFHVDVRLRFWYNYIVKVLRIPSEGQI